nr:reverse transcriptase domain-containing protein [Tanacetum cinerariifolium]
MDKVYHNRQKDVHTRLDFGEGPRERTREDSHHSSARARTTKPKRLKVQDRLRYGDRHVLDRLGHRRQSAFDRLSKTYSPSMTKSRPQGRDSRDRPRGKSRPHRLDTSNEDCPKDRERFCSVEESYDDSFSHSYRDGNRSRHMKRRRDNESPLSSVSKSDSSDVSSRRTRMPNNVKTYDGMRDPEEHVKIFQATAQVERWAIPTWCHMFNSTLIGAARTMEEMMITTTAFIRGEAAAASKKKGHTSWKAHDQSKRQTSDKRSDLRGHSKERRGSNQFTPLTRMPKKIIVAEAGKFQSPPPMVTPLEKRSSNKFCDFHNDKGHITNECMQLKKQIEELVRVGKLSHLNKEIKHGRDQSKTGKKKTPAKDKPTKIYMIQSWQRMTRQKVTQSFERAKEITFPPLTASSETEGPLVIEAKIGGYTIHRMLLVIIGDAHHSTRAWMNFMIVRSLSPYNGIIGKPGIREIQAVSSTTHGMLKFPVKGGIVTIRSTILIPTKCTLVITSSAVFEKIRTRPDNFKVALHPDFLDHEVAIEGTLSEKGRTKLCSILKKNLDIFAWKPSHMTGVPLSVAEHWLNIREGYLPVQQKKRGQAPERAKAIQAEVQNLVEAGIMREVYYHDWLSNPVMVKKHDGSWRMCIDFTNLNKACPHDCYPVSEIDWKVESLCGYPFKCFLDTYKGYLQIQLAEPDAEKTTFYTGQGVYCYTKMPFGLKNAAATYQRLMDKAFDSQIGQNIEVYVDDLVVKSYTEAEMLRDIDETVNTLRKINMKLNPKKCTFGVAEGVFFGHVLTPDGIKPSEKSLPLFKTLKNCIKKSDFHWTAEAEQAFKQLKQHLSELPLLAAPKPKEELIIYLSATYGAISAVIMTKRGATQTPIYFISCVLQGPKLNYTPIEKLVLSLVFAAKRLRRTAAKIEYHAKRTQYHVQPITSIKREILVVFLIEMLDKNPQAAPVAETQQEPWTLFTDGSSSSNNEAAYEALIVGLRIAVQTGVQNVHVSVDSKLVANQVLETYVTKEEHMVKYLDKFKSLVLVEVLRNKSIKEKEVTIVVEEDEPTWMTPIVKYLKEGTLLNDRNEARKLRIKARQYELMEEILYRRSFLTPWLRCVGLLQEEYVIREIHKESCSMHVGLQSAVAKAIRLGYYWPTMHRDARDMIRKCNNCQIHRLITRNPQQPLTPITAPWPFYKWGIDIAGPFPEGPAVIPAEIGMPTYRTAAVDIVSNDKELWLNLDLLEERRERAAIYEAKSKLKMMKIMLLGFVALLSGHVISSTTVMTPVMRWQEGN